LTTSIETRRWSEPIGQTDPECPPILLDRILGMFPKAGEGVVHIEEIVDAGGHFHPFRGTDISNRQVRQREIVGVVAIERLGLAVVENLQASV